MLALSFVLRRINNGIKTMETNFQPFTEEEKNI